MVSSAQQGLFEEAIDILYVMLVNDLRKDTESVGFDHVVVRLLNVFA